MLKVIGAVDAGVRERKKRRETEKTQENVGMEAKFSDAENKVSETRNDQPFFPEEAKRILQTQNAESFRQSRQEAAAQDSPLWGSAVTCPKVKTARKFGSKI
jgi:hypothetical protein